MLKKIEALRKQPVEVRNRYAFWIALIITILIAAVWVSTLPARLEEKKEAIPEGKEAEAFSFPSVGELMDSFNERFGPVIATQEEATTTNDRINLMDLLDATTTPQQEVLPKNNEATTTGSSSASSTPQSD